jgi:hypothetical protein
MTTKDQSSKFNVTVNYVLIYQVESGFLGAIQKKLGTPAVEVSAVGIRLFRNKVTEL